MNRSLLRNPMVLAVVALFAVILLASSVAIVPEWKQAVVLRLEKPIRVVNQYRPNQILGTGAGVIARIPLVDRVLYVDKRVLDVELDDQPVLSTDQQRLQVDAFARYRIVNPLRAVTATGSHSDTEERVSDALKPILGSVLRAELGKREFAALLSPERSQIMENIQVALNRVAAQYGVQIVDVRIKHADLPEGSPLDSALKRMATARDQEARTIEAQGKKRAQIVQADADAQAAQIYAQAFNQDPKFYNFWRAMQSYRHSFGADGTNPPGSTSFILSPDNEYLRQFEHGGD